MAPARYSALDPIWQGRISQPDGMIPLRDHMMRLCGVAEQLSHSRHADCQAVAENLHLAASLRDISVDTDVYGDSFMCGAAADFDEAHSEVAAKYLAGVIVFNHAWSAYEWTIQIASSAPGIKHGKGARGRDLAFRILGDRHFPYLRAAVFDALDRSPLVNTTEMRRMLAAGALAGVAAEHLREFRNAVAHGALEKPFPGDWGAKSEYVANDDPAIRQFHANARLTLLLIQILLRSVCTERDELTAWFSEPEPATLVLTQLHCPFSGTSGGALPFTDARVVRWQDQYFYRLVGLGRAEFEPN